MKVEGWLFVGCAAFFAIMDVIYWHYSKDPTGTTALALSVGLAFLTGFYLLFTGRRLPPRPEDRPEAEIAEGTGELGFFSPHSWWPLITGMSAAVAALGAAVGWWLFLIGMLFVLLSAIGFARTRAARRADPPRPGRDPRRARRSPAPRSASCARALG